VTEGAVTPGVASIPDEQVFAAYAAVPIDRDNIEHYRGLLARRLLINRCSKCGRWVYPHRPLCPSCWSWEVVPTEVSGVGSVFLYTLVHQERDPDSSLEAPLPVAAVELAEQSGLRYLAPVVNCPVSALRLDLPVRLTWVESEGRPSPAFEPAQPSTEAR
jgi:uncharacterized OB-fold protein